MGEVGVITGSISDSVIMDYCTDTLTKHNIDYDVIVASAHRDPDKVRDWVKGASDRGNKVIIAGAGMSAALPGVVVSYTDLPVIGVPMRSELNGLDSLLSISQMPRGVPVACMAIGMHGAINAALFAKRILDQIAEPKFRPGSASAYSQHITPLGAESLGYNDI